MDGVSSASTKMSETNWRQTFESTKLMLQSLGRDKEALVQNLDTIARGLCTLEDRAKLLDYGETHANGYWTFIKVCTRFCQLIEANQRESRNKYSHLLVVSGYLVELTAFLESLGSEDFEDGQTTDPDDRHLSATFEYYTFCLRHRKKLAVLWGHFPGFWLAPSVSKLYPGQTTALAIVGCRLKDLPALTYNKTLRGDFALKTTLKPNLRKLSVFFKAACKVAIPIARLVKRCPTVVCRTVMICPKSQLVLCPKETIRKDAHRGPLQPIRCRFIERKPNTHLGVLLLHFHAGGFMFGSPNMDEIVYLRSWCDQLDGCGILSVDYKLFVPFPGALQQVLDLYFALVEEEHVMHELGFKPKSIILMGENAGATLSVQLALALNDARHLCNLEHLIMPCGIVGICGFYSRMRFMYPSRLIGLMDQTFFGNMLLVMEEHYSGVKEAEQRSGVASFKDWIRNNFYKVLFGSNFEKRLWYLRSEQQFDAFMQTVKVSSSYAYGVPLLYKHFDQIAIPIRLITSHFCQLIDETIILAKMWQGPVTLDVVDHLPHGFLILRTTDLGVKEAHDICIKRLRELLLESDSF